MVIQQSTSKINRAAHQVNSKIPLKDCLTLNLMRKETQFQDQVFIGIQGFNMERKHIKPYLCGLCGESFSKSAGLRKHLPTHTEQARYTCNPCGKMYNEADAFKAHLSTHEQRVKPHICPHCDDVFSAASGLATHICI